MKIVLCTLNAKFIHSSLALFYLREYCRKPIFDIEVLEFTINEPVYDIMTRIFESHPDVVCFSCYIWNIELTLALCRDYRSVDPGCFIILGGPEVSYDADRLLKNNRAVDVVVRGEGEETLNELLHGIYRNTPLSDVEGISYQQAGKVFHQGERSPIADLDSIPNPYRGAIDSLRQRIIYYESSRGCPFRCSYCLSAASPGVRFFSLDRVKADLKTLMEMGAGEIKFVDRTFNCNEKRAREIMQFIIDQEGRTRFHFEICADLLTMDFIDFLRRVPPGLFAFEIGVQSTNPATLDMIERKADWGKLARNITALRRLNTIHLHLDLIAGLPGEGRREFKQSFNQVYSLNPHHIQLGFLKMLKGSPLRQQAEDWGYCWQQAPPYRVLQSRWLSYRDLTDINKVEALLERYYNNMFFQCTLRFVIRHIYKMDAFRFYESFAAYWDRNDLFYRGHRKEEEYNHLIRFIKSEHPAHADTAGEWAKFDFLMNFRHHQLPAELESIRPLEARDRLRDWLKNPVLIDQYSGSGKTGRQFHLEFLRIDPRNETVLNSPLPVLFIYAHGKNRADESVIL